MDELMRALAARRQGQARLPELELQLERANALRDEGYDYRNNSIGGIGAALSGLGTLVNNNTGANQAAAVQPQLAQARGQIAQGDEGRLLHAARRQQEQDALAQQQVQYEQGRDTIADQQWEKEHALRKATAADRMALEQKRLDKAGSGGYQAGKMNYNASAKVKKKVQQATNVARLNEQARTNPYLLRPLPESVPFKKLQEMAESLETTGVLQAAQEDGLVGSVLSGFRKVGKKFGININELSDRQKEAVLFQAKLMREYRQLRTHELYGSAVSGGERMLNRRGEGMDPAQSVVGLLANLDDISTQLIAEARTDAQVGFGGNWHPKDIQGMQYLYGSGPNAKYFYDEEGNLLEPEYHTVDDYMGRARDVYGKWKAGEEPPAGAPQGTPGGGRSAAAARANQPPPAMKLSLEDMPPDLTPDLKASYAKAVQAEMTKWQWAKYSAEQAQAQGGVQ